MLWLTIFTAGVGVCCPVEFAVDNENDGLLGLGHAQLLEVLAASVNVNGMNIPETNYTRCDQN